MNLKCSDKEIIALKNVDQRLNPENECKFEGFGDYKI